jgi:hypothetical protein
MLGWSWWTYGLKDWWGGYAFTLSYDSIDAMGNPVDNVKMTWLSPRAGLTALPHVADNPADTGAEPNVTTARGWESPAITVAQVGGGDGTIVNPILGGTPATVSVQFANRGTGPTDTARSVRLYWAKANSGLSWPYPGNPAPSPWHAVLPSRQLPPLVSCGAAGSVTFDWTPPDPADYGGDDHFCLLACVTSPFDPEWAGFSGTDLNANVLNLRTVGWRNIHIIALQNNKIGNIVASNFHRAVMDAYVELELFDRHGRRIDLSRAGVRLTPHQENAERVRFDGSGFAIPGLKPGEDVTVHVDFEGAPPEGGYTLRATQYEAHGETRRPIGGQTFVAAPIEDTADPSSKASSTRYRGSTS